MGNALAAVFGALTRAHGHAWTAGWRQPRRLGAPVISVGNLSLGGSGKTPATIALALALRARGLRVDVLTRGYGRRSSDLVVLPPSDAPDGLPVAMPTEEAGDEPQLIGAATRVPVVVCADRFRGGIESERRFATQVHLLDDGFQHRRLARDFDLVLVTPSDLEDRLLPAGRLREPLTALRRASALIWMGEAATPAALTALGLPLFAAGKRAVAAPSLPGPLFAFCGLARPESFWKTLAGLGATPVASMTFRDHHRYTPRDAAAIVQRARAAGAACLVTTAKDAVNLRDVPLTLPLRVVEIEFACDRMDALLKLALRACRL